MNSNCAVLVPVADKIEVDTQQALLELERRGYRVFRTRGCVQIDMVRSQMATDFLSQGFEETLWVDSDVGFFPNDVDRIREHGLPVCSALYPRKGQSSFAVKLLPGTRKVTFGSGGGLLEVEHVATGFLHIRREVYRQIEEQQKLPMCNRSNSRGIIPYFLPLVVESGGEYSYLSEDYSFCERIRRAGYKIMADTTVRLWHVGTHRFSWEDASLGITRHDELTIEFEPDGTNVSRNVQQNLP